MAVASPSPVLDELQLFDITQLVARLRISRGKLYLLLQSGELPSIHIGARRLVTAQALKAFIESGTR
jgi:excisionase family DNA binding protein